MPAALGVPPLIEGHDVGQLAIGPGPGIDHPGPAARALHHHRGLVRIAQVEQEAARGRTVGWWNLSRPSSSSSTKILGGVGRFVDAVELALFRRQRVEPAAVAQGAGHRRRPCAPSARSARPTAARSAAAVLAPGSSRFRSAMSPALSCTTVRAAQPKSWHTTTRSGRGGGNVLGRQIAEGLVAPGHRRPGEAQTQRQHEHAHPPHPPYLRGLARRLQACGTLIRQH